MKELEMGEQAHFGEDCGRAMSLWGVRELSQRPYHAKCGFHPQSNSEPLKNKKSRVLQVCRTAGQRFPSGLI